MSRKKDELDNAELIVLGEQKDKDRRAVLGAAAEVVLRDDKETQLRDTTVRLLDYFDHMSREEAISTAVILLAVDFALETAIAAYMQQVNMMPDDKGTVN